MVGWYFKHHLPNLPDLLANEENLLFHLISFDIQVCP
jgi:hypothetical protein